MLVKKLLILCLMAGYLYTLAFSIFITDTLRFPAPIVTGLPLLLFINNPLKQFAYYREIGLFIGALFLYDVIGMDDYKGFFASVIIIVICAFYFNYVIGTSRARLNISVALLFLLLLFSMIIMVLDHSYQSIIDPLRTLLLGEKVKQSPSGIAVTQFTFGYQIAAFSSFVFIAVCAFRTHLLIKLAGLCACLIFLYLGMNRSAFVCFTGVSVLFLIGFYRFKAVLMIAVALLVGFAVYTYGLKNNADGKNNILAKNQAKEANDFNRSDLAAENLKIMADYPWGLIFYGKNWDDVTYRSQVFPFGLTSHNAYLMFLTYLGPFLGIGILLAVYYRILLLLKLVIKNVRLKSNALLVALSGAFIAISLNALSHNGWLMSVDGPTIFLYFAVLHTAKITIPTAGNQHAISVPVTPKRTMSFSV
jgi:hypothetical protein